MRYEPGANRFTKFYSGIEFFLIIVFACIPLLASFPYRVNIFLSWEGAYRMSIGQVPFKDFGLPLGYMFWVVPAFFFKLFGPQLISLIKAQAFINLISGFAFRSILKSIGIKPEVRLLSVIIYCLSYTFVNFWPWYNHTVIVYQMAGLAFLFKYLYPVTTKQNWLWLALAAVFTFFSFFTKQDGGALAFILSVALLIYVSIIDKSVKALSIYVGSFIAVGLIFILPLTQYSFGYWFNHGQPPHTARFSAFDIFDDFFYSSQWIKFYILIIIILMIARFKTWSSLLLNRREMIFLLLTLGILAEAAILQVTSYTPPDNNIFFHSFAFAFIFTQLTLLLPFEISKPRILIVSAIAVCLWWSGGYWKYLSRIMDRFKPKDEVVTTGENIVNRKTYVLYGDSLDIPMSQWKFSKLKAFEKVYMPQPTVEGIERIMNMPEVKANKDLKVLNMSELTPLATEVPFRLEAGSHYPLWYHLGVGMFNKQEAMFEERVRHNYYDLVLFEYIPTLNNFYPFKLRDTLQVYYNKVDSFTAPRRGETRGMIEVYKRKKP